MKRIALIAFAALALAGCEAGLPGGLAQSDVARFAEGMEMAGCVVQSDDKAAIIEKHTGMSDDKLRQISTYMLEQGTLVREGRGIRLTTGKCANA